MRFCRVPFGRAAIVVVGVIMRDMMVQQVGASVLLRFRLAMPRGGGFMRFRETRRWKSQPDRENGNKNFIERHDSVLWLAHIHLIGIFTMRDCGMTFNN